MLDLRIQATPEQLADLRQFLIDNMGDDCDLREITSVSPGGELREPLIIGLVVGLGGPAIVTGFVSIVRRWFEHRENMERMKYKHVENMLKLAILYEDSSKPVTLDGLLVTSQKENE